MLNHHSTSFLFCACYNADNIYLNNRFYRWCVRDPISSQPYKYDQKKENRFVKHLIIPADMKSFRKELWFETSTRRAFLNITNQVEKCLSESGIKEGLVLVNAMHISASVFINDDESGLHHDFEVWLEKLAPEKPYSQYQHNGFEDNADAHIKRTLMGREVVVAVTNGHLDFGPWEQIFYGEFDGKRRKRVLVKIIGA